MIEFAEKFTIKPLPPSDQTSNRYLSVMNRFFFYILMFFSSITRGRAFIYWVVSAMALYPVAD